MKILKIKSLNINSLKGEFEVDFEKFLKDEHMKEGKYNCEVSEMI